MYSDRSFVIPDKYFHAYYKPFWDWKISPLATIKDSTEY